MKLEDIFEAQELMPRSPFKKADALGREFVKMAMERSSDNPELMAKKIAANFHKAMVAAIDEDLKFRQMKRADAPNEERDYGYA